MKLTNTIIIIIILASFPGSFSQLFNIEELGESMQYLPRLPSFRGNSGREGFKLGDKTNNNHDT